MLKTLKTCVVKSINAEISVNVNVTVDGKTAVVAKPVMVSITDEQVNVNVPLTEDYSSSVNVSINRKTGKSSNSQNNVDSVSAANTLISAITTQLQAITAEIETI